MRIIISLHIIILLGTVTLFAQVSDSLKVQTSETDSTFTEEAGLSALSDSLNLRKSEEIIKTVAFWNRGKDAIDKTVNTDSLMRWQFWPNWGDFYANRKDVIPYRLGTIGRQDAFTINGYSSYEQQLYLDDLQLNDPITGLLNYNLVPHLKLGNVNESYINILKTNIYTKNYYLTKPRSFLNYDEGGEGYRNLEFVITQNTSPTTNFELSYWDRREDGYYPNSKVNGSQIFGKLNHHITDRYFLQFMLLRNQFDRDESFGYNIGDPNVFEFNEFTTQPNQQSAKSEFLRNDIKIGIYSRGDSTQNEDGGLIITKSRNDYNLKFTADTLFWDVNEYKAKLFKKISLAGIDLKGDLEGYHTAVKDSSVLAINNWGGLNFTGDINSNITNKLGLYLNGNYHVRDDGKSTTAISGGIKIVARKLETQFGYSIESRMPGIQNMYWLARDYTGNKNLANEEIQSIYASINYGIGEKISLGAAGRFKKVDDAILLADDHTFQNEGNYTKINASVFARYNSGLFDIESSAVMEQIMEQTYLPDMVNLNAMDNLLLLRNSVFLKGYVFDKAAFIKAGIRTIFSTNYYHSKTYNTALHYWQNSSLEQPIPGYFRLDAELSARVRAIMVYVTWENALDGLGQAGYFETAGYPLWPRRLLVGIRAQFIN